MKEFIWILFSITETKKNISWQSSALPQGHAWICIPTLKKWLAPANITWETWPLLFWSMITTVSSWGNNVLEIVTGCSWCGTSKIMALRVILNKTIWENIVSFMGCVPGIIEWENHFVIWGNLKPHYRMKEFIMKHLTIEGIHFNFILHWRN